MGNSWTDTQPIYRQLRERVAGLIMSGAFTEGEAIPSVRKVSAEEQINHLTVAKAYQELVDEGVLEMRRGRGMFVVEGARDRLRKMECDKFKKDEVPALVARLSHLNISVEELVELIKQRQGG